MRCHACPSVHCFPAPSAPFPPPLSPALLQRPPVYAGLTRPSPPTFNAAVVPQQIRLLHRNIGVRIGGANDTTLFGTIEHPAGNISVELLKNGLGRMVDWSLRACPCPPALPHPPPTPPRAS
jgi:hypothetical protein